MIGRERIARAHLGAPKVPALLKLRLIGRSLWRLQLNAGMSGQSMSTVVVVQKLLRRWEKTGRGHPVASVRANLPSALELPPVLLDGPVAYHSIIFDQRVEFAPLVSHHEKRVNLPEHGCGLSLVFDESHLCASFQWAQDCGAPRRNAGVPTRLFELAVGEFGPPHSQRPLHARVFLDLPTGHRQRRPVCNRNGRVVHQRPAQRAGRSSSRPVVTTTSDACEFCAAPYGDVPFRATLHGLRSRPGRSSSSRVKPGRFVGGYACAFVTPAHEPRAGSSAIRAVRCDGCATSDCTGRAGCAPRFLWRLQVNAGTFRRTGWPGRSAVGHRTLAPERLSRRIWDQSPLTRVPTSIGSQTSVKVNQSMSIWTAGLRISSCGRFARRSRDNRSRRISLHSVS